jgi:hypothetical protein
MLMPASFQTLLLEKTTAGLRERERPHEGVLYQPSVSVPIQRSMAVEAPPGTPLGATELLNRHTGTRDGLEPPPSRLLWHGARQRSRDDMKIDSLGYQESVAQAAERAIRAERDGYDTWWATEPKADPFLECLIAAERTERIAIPHAACASSCSRSWRSGRRGRTERDCSSTASSTRTR